MRLIKLGLFSVLFVFLIRTQLFAQIKAGYDDDGMVTVNGERIFIIGSYHTPKSGQPYRELAEAGFNLVRVGTSAEQLDQADRAGLYTWISIGTLDLQDSVQSANKLLKKVNDFKDHPSLLIWESVDEPAWTWKKAEPRVRPKPLVSGYNLVRSADANHLFYMNHAPVNLVSTLQKYNGATDIVACDIYPVIPHGIRPMYALFDDGLQGDLLNCTISQVGEYADKMRRVAGPDRPVFMVLQGFAWEMLRKENERDSSMILFPTLQQSRFMAYNAIIHGVNGILYWGTAYTPQPSAFWSDLKRVVKEIASLSEVLGARTIKLKIDKVYHEMGHSVDAGVEILCKKANNSVYLITANADKNPVKVTLKGLGDFGRAEVIGEDRSVNIRDGALTDIYQPFDVHVYRMHE